VFISGAATLMLLFDLSDVLIDLQLMAAQNEHGQRPSAPLLFVWFFCLFVHFLVI
jgi:hypothetical protein